jgi:hypothetical protein
LDAAKFPVTVAFWLLQTERSRDWRLVIATPLYEKLGFRDAYTRLRTALSSNPEISLIDSPIEMEGAKRPMIRDLREQLGRAAAPRGKRIDYYSLGDAHVDDAYIQRAK